MAHSFEAAFREIEQSLFWVAMGYLRNTEDARDAVQDAALSAYRAYQGLRHPEYFKTWMTRIVINTCRDQQRRRQQTVELQDDLGALEGIPEEELALFDAICRLGAERARYLTLRFYHEMTYEEVAELLHQPLSTVKYRTRRALEDLRLEWKGEEHDH